MHTKFINTGHLDSRKLQNDRHDTRGHLLDTASVDKKRTRVPASVGWGIGSGYGSGLVDWKITCAKDELEEAESKPRRAAASLQRLFCVESMEGRI